MNYNDGKKTRSSNTGAEHTAKRATFEGKVSVPPEFQLLDRYWKASNYLSVGQVSYTKLCKLIKIVKIDNCFEL